MRYILYSAIPWISEKEYVSYRGLNLAIMTWFWYWMFLWIIILFHISVTLLDNTLRSGSFVSLLIYQNWHFSPWRTNSLIIVCVNSIVPAIILNCVCAYICIFVCVCGWLFGCLGVVGCVCVWLGGWVCLRNRRPIFVLRDLKLNWVKKPSYSN
jgi:hypothetical protein